MIFGLKNGLTFESQYTLSTMNTSVLSGESESLPLRININAIENTQSSNGQQENLIASLHQCTNINIRTPMRVQVEYPDSISRKRRHHQSFGQQPSKKVNSVNSKSAIEQFREECLEEDVLLSQIADFQVNDELVPACSENGDNNLTFGLSDTGRVFARCYTLPVEKSPKKGKVIVYDSDGLGGESD